jgi:uncharacterized membrane protein
MMTLTVFSVGLFAGAAWGIFSIIILEVFTCGLAFLDSWSEGFGWACANATKMGMVLLAGFLVALIVAGLSPKFEREATRWLRRQRSGARNRSIMHGPQ